MHMKRHMLIYFFIFTLVVNKEKKKKSKIVIKCYKMEVVIKKGERYLLRKLIN
jgi:hypothetical protein